MATVPTGYVFWDVSANKSYAAGKTFPTLGEGDYLCPATTSQSSHFHVYEYRAKAFTDYDISFEAGVWRGFISSYYTSKASPGAPFKSIAGKPVRSMSYYGCTKLTTPPNISEHTNLYVVNFRGTAITAPPTLPSSIKSLNYCFYECKSLKTAPEINHLTNLEHAYRAFRGCTSLTTAPDMSGLTELTDTSDMFYGCTSLTTAPDMSGLTKLTTAYYMFYGCTSLTTAPDMSSLSAIQLMYNAFMNCTALTQGTNIPSNVTSATGIYLYCTKLSGVLNIKTLSLDAENQHLCRGTKEPISLFNGSGATDDYMGSLIDTSTLNVVVGSKAKITSFSAQRCDEDGTLSAVGEYVLLTEAFEKTYKGEGYDACTLYPPSVEGLITSDTLTWHLDTLKGTEVTSDGVEMPESGALVALVKTELKAQTIKITNNSKVTLGTESMQQTSNSAISSLSYSDFIIDVKNDDEGISIAFGEEANNPGYIKVADSLILEVDGSESILGNLDVAGSVSVAEGLSADSLKIAEHDYIEPKILQNYSVTKSLSSSTSWTDTDCTLSLDEGMWMISAALYFPNPSNGSTVSGRACRLYNHQTGSDAGYISYDQRASRNDYASTCNVCVPMYVSADTAPVTIEIQGYQNSGKTLSAKPRLYAMRIG